VIQFQLISLSSILTFCAKNINRIATSRRGASNRKNIEVLQFSFATSPSRQANEATRAIVHQQTSQVPATYEVQFFIDTRCSRCRKPSIESVRQNRHDFTFREHALTWASTEVSVSSRAGCQSTHCKKEEVKIQKGELRQGVLVTIRENTAWKWRHWYGMWTSSLQYPSLTALYRGCVTPTVLNNWATLAGAEDGEIDFGLIDGYEELPDECQEKVQRALRELHVDDEDWMGVCGD
jgi:hypothetical protein